MAGLPADIVNRALDGIGRSDLILGDLEEGTEAAKPALRAYGPALRQLLRSAHWAFARAQKPLRILADATGQTPGVDTNVPAPWLYLYEYPIDCMKARFLPWNTTPVQPNPPIMTGLAQPPLNSVRLVPAPFQLLLDFNHPVVTGGPPVTWDSVPQWWGVQGEGPVQRTAIATNVPPTPTGTSPTQFPNLIYTALVIYPSQWDPLFEEAMVTFLMQKLAMPLARDAKAGLAIRNEAIRAARSMIEEARIVNANESSYPQTTDHNPDWMRVRNAGSGWGAQGMGGWGGFNGSAGGYSMGWDQCAFADGSVY